MTGKATFTALALCLLAACQEAQTPAETAAAPAVTQTAPPARPAASTASSLPAASPPTSGRPPSGSPVSGPAASSPIAPAASVSRCQVQDGKGLALPPVRALGTEPFWSAAIDGRCVTYSTPEDQAGTRVWTHYSTAGDRQVWTGALGGRRFALRVEPAAGCSDGMSDRAYPLAARLEVAGEVRTGCAFPAAGTRQGP